MKIVELGRFSIYVYREATERHHLPHCNVRWADGDSQVSLRTLTLLAGDPLPRAARRLLREQIELVRTAWDELNPELPV